MRARYGNADQPITITLAGLGDRFGRESAKIDNRVLLYDDVYISGRIKTTTKAGNHEECLQVYAYGSQNGTVFPTPATGIDAALGGPVDALDWFVPIGYLSAPAADTSFTGGLWSIARALGGVVPPFWGIVVMNDTGTTLSATPGDHEFVYQGLWRDVEGLV